MRVAIVGSRGYKELVLVRAFVAGLSPDDVVISGGAAGVDRTAVAEARARGLATLEIRAEWDKYGRGAGMMRNSQIVAEAEKLVAFWDGTSRGTYDSIEKARAKGIPVLVF